MARVATRLRPFLLENARVLSPVLLTCEHATHRLPIVRDVRAAHWEVLGSHWGWDIGAWHLTRELSQQLEATAIGGRWSRLWIDLNRRVGDRTLIRPKAGRVVLPWNEGLDAGGIERRILGYHTPYHTEVDRLILRRLVRGLHPVLVAVHTFTPRLGRQARPFQIGILYEDHRKLAHLLGRELRGCGLSVRYNQPYSGLAGMMYSIDRHGSHHRLPCLELEVNQRMFAEPGAVPRLARLIARGLRVLAAETR
jgi:predicted N-formylglutamate amidohydrolase